MEGLYDGYVILTSGYDESQQCHDKIKRGVAMAEGDK
jgi:hypothetical protein